MIPKFTNKDGSLTAYAFSCGYIQRQGNGHLYKDGVYHVSTPDTWESFSLLADARKALARLTK